MSQKRKKSRMNAVVPVRIARTKDSNGEQVIIAHTYDISPEGARVGGIQEDLSVGEIVTLDRRGRRARFSVCWKAENGIIGLQCLEPGRDIWDLESEFEAREKEKLTEENALLKSPNRFSFLAMLRWTTAKVVRPVQGRARVKRHRQVAAAMKEKRHADIAALLNNVNILMEEKG